MDILSLARRVGELEAELDQLRHLKNIYVDPPLWKDEDANVGLSIGFNAPDNIDVYDQTIEIADGTPDADGIYDALTDDRTAGAFVSNIPIWAIDLAGSTSLTVGAKYPALIVRDEFGKPVEEAHGPSYVAIATSQGFDLTDTTRWLKVVGSISPAAWSAVVTYVAGNLVTSGGNTYVCILAHTNHVPPNSTYWDLLPSGVTSKGGYDGQTTYTAGQYVREFRTMYVMLSVTGGGGGSTQPFLRLVDGVKSSDGTYAANLLTIDPTTKARSIGAAIWGVDLSNAQAPLTVSEDYLCHPLTGAGVGGPSYMAIDATTGDPLTDATKWIPLLSNPLSVLAYVDSIVNAVDIANGAQGIVAGSAPTDFASTLDVIIVDSDASITIGIVRINGTDLNGDAIVEEVDISGGGTSTYTTTKAYKTVTAITVKSLVGAVAGDTIQVIITQYDAGVMRTNAGNTWLVDTSTPGGVAPAPTDWISVTGLITNAGTYSALTSYTLGLYVRAALAIYGFEAVPDASSTARGVITARSQNIKGYKSFLDTIVSFGGLQADPLDPIPPTLSDLGKGGFFSGQSDVSVFMSLANEFLDSNCSAVLNAWGPGFAHVIFNIFGGSPRNLLGDGSDVYDTQPAYAVSVDDGAGALTQLTGVYGTSGGGDTVSGGLITTLGVFIKNNYAGVGPPTTGDDSTQGYTIGSVWIG